MKAEGGDASVLPAREALRLLREGELEIVGQLLDASNVDLYCAITLRCPDPEPDLEAACVYKPIDGERPLDDFPDGTLAFREVAAYIVSAATGWKIVPPTVLREGPFGLGMVQLWIEVDPTVDPLRLIRARHPQLRRMAIFDAVVNNADRKAGHLLPAPDGHVYGCDHGVCFAEEPKLRTVLWNWRGQALDEDELEVLRRLRAGLRGELAEELRPLLSLGELSATRRRIDALLATGCFPLPDPDRPAIPWPPF